MFDELSSETGDTEPKTAPETIADDEDVKVVRVIKEDELEAAADQEKPEETEDKTPTEQPMIANINATTTEEAEGANNEQTADEKKIKQSADGEKNGPDPESQTELKVREAAETLAMLSKPANT